MTTIVFKLREDTPAGEVGTALKEICSMTSLFNVKAVFPDAGSDDKFSKVFTADVTSPAATLDVLKAVKKVPYVAEAYQPPGRSTL